MDPGRVREIRGEVLYITDDYVPEVMVEDGELSTENAPVFRYNGVLFQRVDGVWKFYERFVFSLSSRSFRTPTPSIHNDDEGVPAGRRDACDKMMRSGIIDPWRLGQFLEDRALGDTPEEEEVSLSSLFTFLSFFRKPSNITLASSSRRH